MRKTYKNGDEARRGTRKTGLAWFAYFALILFLTFFPGLYPYHVVEPFIMGIPAHLFKWFIITVLLIGGIIVFEFTVWWKWRGDDK